MQLSFTKTLFALAAVVVIVKASPAGPIIVDLRAASAALENPNNLPTVWVVDDCDAKACNLSKGHLELEEDYLTKHGLPHSTSSNTDLDNNRGDRIYCSGDHKARSDACSTLINTVRDSGIKYVEGTSPRSTCGGGCCVSWSTDASFDSSDLAAGARECFDICSNGIDVSCVTRGVRLGGKNVDVCVSNRPNGCT